MKRKSSVIIPWIIGCALIAILSLSFILVFYFTYKNELENQSSEYNLYVTKAMADNINDTLVSLFDVYSDVSTLDEIKDVLSIREPSDYYTSMGVMNFMNNFTESRVYKNKYEFYFLYMPETDMVLSQNGILSSNEFFDLRYSGFDIGYEEFINQLDIENGYEFYSVQRKDSEKCSILYNVKLAKPYVSTGTAILSVCIAEETFFDTIDEMEWVKKSDVYIFNSSGQFLLTRHGDSNNNTYRRLSDIPASSNKQVVMKNSIEFDSISLMLVTMAQRNVLFERMAYWRMISLVLIIFYMMVLGITIYYFIRINYRPIGEILSSFEIPHDKNNESNEFANIRKYITQILSQNKGFSEQIEKTESNLRSMSLKAAMSGMSIEMLEDFEKEYTYDSIMTLIFSADIPTGFFENDDRSVSQQNNEVLFIIQNVFNELLVIDGCKADILNVDSKVTCIINFRNQDESVFSLIKEKLEYGIKFINQHFSIEVSYSASRVHSGNERLITGYREAMYAYDYKNIMNMHKTVCYDEVPINNQSSGYFYDIEKERQLITAIGLGNIEEAVNIVNEVFGSIEDAQAHSVNAVRCILIDLMVSLMKLPQYIAYGEKTSLSEEQIIENCSDIATAKKFVLDYIEKYCAGNNRNGRSNLLINNIVSYIAANYSDYGLGVDVLGNKFNMYPSYLSKQFKNSTGMSPVDYINTIRIGKAKELMKESRNSFAEISDMVGYNNIRTFNRIFKKYEGVTPSQWISKN